MGILGSLFGKDWQAELDRAATLLAEGEAVRALELARQVERRGGRELTGRAAELSQRARDAVVETLLANAEKAEGEGDLRDAADWLLAALDHLEGDARAAEVEARREDLLEREEEGRNPYARAGVGGETATGLQDDFPTGQEAHYEALINALDEELAERYEGRPEAFRNALVALNEGRFDSAVEALAELLEGAPEDPVLQLELGRARLLADDPEGARELLEQAWLALGDGPLDATDSLSIPLLWAEAARAGGLDADEIVERLSSLSPPIDERPTLAALYADTLLVGGRLKEARELLGFTLRRFPSNPELSLLMARALAASGEPERAIDGLEALVGPACRGGRCAPGRLHLPSVRELSRLYLDKEAGHQRVGELMAVVARNQGGLLSAADHEILARWYQQTGETEAATHCAAEARRLAGQAAEELSAAPLPPPGQRPVL
jgi:tetratricopeptide (TPR) repeat protein